jgi:hypothetical protein
MIRRLIGALGLALLLSACGGGGGGGSSGSSSSGGTTTTPALSNFATLVVDGGPSAVTSGPNGYIAGNVAYVTITLCAPGSTTNCQTIDHVQVDTGSIGLRIPQSVLSSTLLSALSTETDASGNPVGECYQYVDGYRFGSVRTADFTIGGEKVAGMPFQVAGDTGAFSTVPTSCSNKAGTNLATVSALGANGIIGVGTMATDCAAACTVAGGEGAAFYFDCPSSGCGSIIARAANTTAPFQQLPNPVAAMSVDNNGVILTFPTVPSTGEASVSGTMYFGIGTQTNNGLGSATVLTATSSSNPNGSGLVTALFNGQTLPDSFIDSGSSVYFFVDSNIALCTDTANKGYYCPPSPVALSPQIQGQTGTTASAAFTLYNADTLLNNNSYAAIPGIGGDPNALSLANPYPTSFDFGLPFFYGRTVFTAIEGRQAGSTVGPYYAF